MSRGNRTGEGNNEIDWEEDLKGAVRGKRAEEEMMRGKRPTEKEHEAMDDRREVLKRKQRGQEKAEGR